jgi:hypothetical protein
MLKFSGYSCLIGGPIGRSIPRPACSGVARTVFLRHRLYASTVTDTQELGTSHLDVASMEKHPYAYTYKYSQNDEWLFHLGICTHNECKAGARPSNATLVGMNRHSNRHTPQREVQDAFKILMTHWILQFA